MVLALLSGAALSCTKDYSKEIADVQKKNQELEGLIATLQNAINSTNTTVSQVSALANKNEADILDLATANAEAFADIIADHAADVENLEELIDALETAGVEQKEELEGAINALRVALNEGKTSIDSEIAALKTALIDEIKRSTDKDVELAATIAALVTKTDADIARINAALDTKADKTDVDEKVAILNAAIQAVNDALAQKTEELKENIDKSAEESKRADKALADKLAEAKAKITSNENRIEAIEDMLADYPEVKAQVATNKLDIAALQRQVEELNAQIDETKAAYKAADKALQEQIDELKEVLSARLTNIVAAPAKIVEMLSVTIGDSTFVNLQMDFKVAPAAFAKTIADGFESDDVKVALNITNGYARTRGNAVSEDIDTLVTPFKVVSTKDGIISVTANLSGIVNTPAVNFLFDTAFAAGEPSTNKFAPYVSIIVSGTDYEGLTYERISDPVIPIRGSIAHGNNILTALKWFKGDKPVAQVEETDVAVKAIKAANEKKDTAVANNGHLKVVLADIDWKTYEEFSNTNVLEGYELMIPVGEGNPFNKPISIEEIAEMLNIDYDVFAPYFVKPINKGTLTIGYRTQIEWTDYPYAAGEQTQAEMNLFTANNPKGIEIGIGVGELPEGTNAEQAEFVGLWYEVTSNEIVYGKVDTLDEYDVYVVQRIGKHVSNQEVASPLTVPFAYNAGDPDTYTADHSNKKFTAVAWKGETDIARHTTGRLVKKGDNYTDENYVKYGVNYATATVTATSSQTKFADIELVNVPFQDKVQEYELVWLFEPYKNSKGVQAEDYLDYINVTVAPYHETVKVIEDPIEEYFSMTGQTKINTKITPTTVLGSDNTWFDPQEIANQTAWKTWYSEGFGDENKTISADTLGSKVNGYFAKDNVSLKYEGTSNKLAVTFNPVPYAFAGKEYTVHAVDTIDNVIAFDYSIPVVAKTIGATIATIPGFVQEGVVNVIGAAKQEEGVWCYRIPDINLDNYFRFVNLKQINTNDLVSLKVEFSKPANVSVSIDQATTTPGTYSTDGKQATLLDQCKVSWNTYNETEFELTANTKVGNTVIANPVKVKFKTVDPVAGNLTDPYTTVAFEASVAQTISVLNGLQIKPVGFANLIEIGNDNLAGILVANSATTPNFGFIKSYPTEGPINTWKCTVADNPFNLGTLIETEAGSYGWNENHSDFTIKTKEHDALGRIVITIPFTWEYMFGTLNFDAIIVIE